MNKHIEEAIEEIIQGYFGHPEHWGPHDPQRAMELKKIARQVLTSIYQRGREDERKEWNKALPEYPTE